MGETIDCIASSFFLLPSSFFLLLYKSLVKKLCPNAKVTVDRFHVTKIVQEELNQARIDPKKTASSLNDKTKAQVFGSFKGSKYTLLKVDKKLSKKQKQKLKEVK